MKYAAVIEYDGTKFHGWQSQPHARNIQDHVAAAFSKVADHPIGVVCAGRTDAGVHAFGQVIHFTTNVQRSIDEWQRGAGSYLPEDISITTVVNVDDDFHARYSALQRYYRYVIFNHSEKHTLIRYFTTHIYQPLDAKAMHDASQALVGEHDFSSFRAAGCCSKSPVRCVSGVEVRRWEDFVIIDICANAFVQHMVRNIAGNLIAIGSGAMPVKWLAELLSYRDRTRGGFAAESRGLYLRGVKYDMRYNLPDATIYDRFVFPYHAEPS